jgi:hypothetical protein
MEELRAAKEVKKTRLREPSQALSQKQQKCKPPCKWKCKCKCKIAKIVRKKKNG